MSTSAARILCVDDEKKILNSLGRGLRARKYQVETAETAEEAFEILENRYVDVIVADQQMPGMRGNELLRMVRERYPDVIRIMLSGHTDFNELVQAVNEGEIFRFVAKPCESAELARIIQMALEQKGLLAVLAVHLTELCGRYADQVTVETFQDQGYCDVKINNLMTADQISRLTQVIMTSLQSGKAKAVKLTSGVVARDEESVVVSLDVNKGVGVKIEFTHPASIPAWVPGGSART